MDHRLLREIESTRDNKVLRARDLTGAQKALIILVGSAALILATAVGWGITHQPSIPEPEPATYPSGSIVIQLPTEAGVIVGICDGPNRVYMDNRGLKESVKDDSRCTSGR